ncbi:MAG: HAD family hydrolase, partial [Chloroflexi bacterium]|nr:HAD family hydrolase [Chloroflexota bacterium]
MNDLVVLLDVDNTLLDNDLVRADLERDLAGVLGGPDAGRFWEIYEEVRIETDLVNF